MKRKVSWSWPKPKNWAVEPQENKTGGWTKFRNQVATAIKSLPNAMFSTLSCGEHEGVLQFFAYSYVDCGVPYEQCLLHWRLH
jgi:hypothetical protein